MTYFFRQTQMAKGWGKEIRDAWDEADHPRGKTTPESTPGSFAPRGGEGGSANIGQIANDALAAHLDDDEDYLTTEQRAQGFGVATVGEGYKELERSRAYKPPEKIGIGAILSSSWGYGQTNVDYYQVTGMSSSGKTVTLREVAALDVQQGQRGAGAMSGKKRALPDEFTGKPFQRRIGSNGRIKIRDYASASLWDGKDDYYSWDH